MATGSLRMFEEGGEGVCSCLGERGKRNETPVDFLQHPHWTATPWKEPRVPAPGGTCSVLNTLVYLA